MTKQPKLLHESAYGVPGRQNLSEDRATAVDGPYDPVSAVAAAAAASATTTPVAVKPWQPRFSPTSSRQAAGSDAGIQTKVSSATSPRVYQASTDNTGSASHGSTSRNDDLLEVGSQTGPGKGIGTTGSGGLHSNGLGLYLRILPRSTVRGTSGLRERRSVRGARGQRDE